MYVSHSLRCVYMAVPRTGSRSVARWLQDDHAARASRKKAVHGNHHGVDAPVLAECRKMGYRIICPVRNPWDVIVSWWHHNPNWFGLGNAEFPQFVEWFPKHGRNRYLDEGRLYSFWSQHATRIVKYERLRQDLARILHVPINLPHIGKSARGPYQEYYTPELRDYVAEKFAPEIEQYGYRFEELE